MEQNIEITRGDTASFNLQFVDFAGDLEHDVQDMFLTVKEDINGSVLFQKSLGNGISKVIDNVYVVRIAPEDTEDLNLGFYYYDLEVKINDDVFTLLKGVMQIAYDVTDPTSIITIAPYAELQDIRVGYNGDVYPSAGDAVRDQVNDLHEEVDVLDGRMDEFASLPEGSTAGNAELVDIRVGANGITYPSAGDAVRGQVEELDDKVLDNATDIGDINTDVDVLKARMNTFASLPDGSTAGDAELEDIRVGADGVTYASAGDAVRGQVSDLKADLDAVNDIVDNSIGLKQDGTNTTSNYYKNVNLKQGITYRLILTVPTTGTYKIQAGPEASAGSMVDTIYDGNLTQGVNVIDGYTPIGNYVYLRSSVDAVWSVSYYHYEQGIPAVLDDYKANGLKTMVISASDFAQAPYNNYISNLDGNSIVNINTSYDAHDFPMNDSGIYTIITFGTSPDKTQLAIKNSGVVYSRVHRYNAWSDWAYFDALYCSWLQLTDRTVYTSFNDFPVGSIIDVTNTADLDDAPDGYNNVGHVVFDSGLYHAIVMTFSYKQGTPLLKAQVCYYYRNVTDGYPRIAYRTAIYVSGAYKWSNWSILSEGRNIHATNRIVDGNHLEYTFDDFNDAPINTIYQVDLNVANLVANNPSPSHSGNLMTYGFSDSTNHAVVQQFIALENGIPTEYIRYGYFNNPDYEWTAWRKVVTESI